MKKLWWVAGIVFMGVMAWLGGFAGSRRSPVRAAMTAPTATPEEASVAGGLASNETPVEVAAGTAAPAEPVPGNASGAMRQVTVRDEGFNIPAFTMQIPAGWQLDGGVIRTVNCSLGDPFLVFNVHSTDQTYSAEIVSPFFTFWPRSTENNIQGCGQVMPPMQAGELLTRVILPKLRPGVKYSPPEASLASDQERFQRNISDMQQQVQAGGYSARVTGSQARVHLQYTIQGKPVEEWIEAETQATQGTRITNMVNTQSTVSITRAPQGRWAESVFSFGKTIAPEPAWQQRQAAYGQQVAQRGAQARQQIAAQAQANINATVARTNQTINNIHAIGARGQANVDAIHGIGAASMAADRERMGAMDWSAKGTAAYVGDNYKYRTPAGNTVYTNTPASADSGWEEIR